MFSLEVELLTPVTPVRASMKNDLKALRLLSLDGVVLVSDRVDCGEEERAMSVVSIEMEDSAGSDMLRQDAKCVSQSDH